MLILLVERVFIVQETSEGRGVLGFQCGVPRDPILVVSGDTLFDVLPLVADCAVHKALTRQVL